MTPIEFITLILLGGIIPAVVMRFSFYLGFAVLIGVCYTLPIYFLENIK